MHRGSHKHTNDRSLLVSGPPGQSEQNMVTGHVQSLPVMWTRDHATRESHVRRCLHRFGAKIEAFSFYTYERNKGHRYERSKDPTRSSWHYY